MTDIKWEHEKETALRFLRLFGEAEPCLLRPPGPHPDVPWDGPLGAIGLELTRLVANQTLVEREALRERVLSQARKLSESLGVGDLFVWVHWHDDAPPPGLSSLALAEDLLTIVRQNLPDDGQSRKLGTDIDFDQEFEHPTFDRLAIDRSEVHGGVFFTTAYSDWLRDLNADQLRSVIAGKSSKNRPAMPPVSEHWLVIYGGHGPLSSYMEPEPSALLATYPSAFDRTFLTFLSEGRFWQLATTRLSLGASQ